MQYENNIIKNLNEIYKRIWGLHAYFCESNMYEKTIMQESPLSEIIKEKITDLECIIYGIENGDNNGTALTDWVKTFRKAAYPVINEYDKLLNELDILAKSRELNYYDQAYYLYDIFDYVIRKTKTGNERISSITVWSLFDTYAKHFGEDDRYRKEFAKTWAYLYSHPEKCIIDKATESRVFEQIKNKIIPYYKKNNLVSESGFFFWKESTRNDFECMLYQCITKMINDRDDVNNAKHISALIRETSIYKFRNNPDALLKQAYDNLNLTLFDKHCGLEDILQMPHLVSNIWNRSPENIKQYILRNNKPFTDFLYISSLWVIRNDIKDLKPIPSFGKSFFSIFSIIDSSYSDKCNIITLAEQNKADLDDIVNNTKGLTYDDEAISKELTDEYHLDIALAEKKNPLWAEWIKTGIYFFEVSRKYPKEIYDFSGSVIYWCKALEDISKNVIYDVLETDPELKSKNTLYKLILNDKKEYTLGKYTYLFYTGDKGSDYDHSKLNIEAIKEAYSLVVKNNQITLNDFRDNIIGCLVSINKDYRINSAHRSSLSYVQAEKCKDLIFRINHVFSYLFKI